MKYQPQLAQLVKAPPEGADWIHELKYDGYRIGARITGSGVTLISRNGHDWTAAFPEIARAARRLRTRDALIDGEVCVLLPDGRTSFQALQNASHGHHRAALVYFVFDLLRLDGRDLLTDAIEERKRALKRLVGARDSGRIRYADHIAGDGRSAFAEACRLGLEGIVSKRLGQPYQPGKRVGWLKTKCVQRQEFVIGGFTDPEGSRQGIGALLVGYYERDRLVFAGKVGTGFTVRGARDLRSTLDRLEIEASPFTPPPPGWLGRHAHWVKPTLVAEVVFAEWTSDGLVRHPSFQGLRADKRAESVVRERAAPPASGRKKKTSTRRRASSAAKPSTIAGITITHPDRVMYERPRLTKLDIARYYEQMASWMLPHVQGRPLTLVRCGQGLGGPCIFMKHSKLWAPPALRRVKIQEKTKIGDYLIADTVEALVSLAQMDILEIHTWNTRIDRVEHPDRLVIDLDPGEQITWPDVVAAAVEVRTLLETLDLASYVKTTGGRGLHVVVPLARRQEWRACLEFARAFADALARHDPSRYTTDFGKKGRARQILVDYLRNNRTNTSIAAFSTRARAGAPVSVPLAWSELGPSLDPASFTAESVPARFARRPDPWTGYWNTRQSLSSRALKALQQLDV